MKYEKCLDCKQLGETCDGPNFLAMDGSELGLWCDIKRKQNAGLTYDKIAAQTGLSKSAVYNFMHGKHPDYRIETVRPIVKIVTGGKWDDNACGNVSNSEKAQYETQRQWHEDKIQHITTENKILYTSLKRKDKYITLLAIALAICLIAIVGSLLIDYLNNNVGFFWIDKLSATFSADGVTAAAGKITEWRL